MGRRRGVDEEEAGRIEGVKQVDVPSTLGRGKNQVEG